MTRRVLLRLILAIKMGISGNSSAFRWLLPRRMKLPRDEFYWLSRSVLDAITNYPGCLVDDLFYSTKRPLLQLLRERSASFSGGTFIQAPLSYGNTEGWV